MMVSPGQIMARIRNERRRIPYESFLLEVDRTRYPDGTVEVEVEVETEDIEGARATVEAVARLVNVRLVEQPKTKYRRFLERVGLPARVEEG